MGEAPSFKDLLEQFRICYTGSPEVMTPKHSQGQVGSGLSSGTSQAIDSLLTSAL